MPRTSSLLAAIALAAPAAALAQEPSDKDIRASVVKIEVTQRPTDLGRPWLRPASHEISGTGLVIDGKRVLTNAHVAGQANRVTVQGNKSSEKFTAKVEALATGIDLAILRIDDESFFEGKPPIPISEGMPKDREGVHVYGFPTGGNNLSVTKGIVSRVEFTSYDGETMGLRAQIDAAINPGNSGGPVIADGKLLGVAFSRLGGADNIGYVIPSEEVRIFLDDVKDGKYDGKPALFDDLQTLENPALRKFLKLPKGTDGIVVHRPTPPVTGESPLKEWDLITKIGDHEVDNTGMSQVAEGMSLAFQYYVQKLAKDGKVPLTIVREGKEMAVEVPVMARKPLVIPTLRGNSPSYFIYGPFVFTAASRELVLTAERSRFGTWSMWVALNQSPLGIRLFDRPQFEGEELVTIPSPLFTHPVSKGYSDVRFQTIRSINGVKIKNLKHLVETLRDAKDDLLVIAFNEAQCETMVLDRKAAQEATEEILADNSIRKQGSDDLMAVWEKK